MAHAVGGHPIHWHVDPTIEQEIAHYNVRDFLYHTFLIFKKRKSILQSETGNMPCMQGTKTSHAHVWCACMDRDMHTYRRAAERIKPAGAPATHSAAKATRCALVPRVITSCFLDLLPHSACSPLIYWWQSHVVISFAFSVSSLTSHLSPSQHFSRVRSPALLLSLACSLARVRSLSPFLSLPPLTLLSLSD